MGIVYKITKEIQDFIISQKKSNPSLSCRALSNLVQQSFQAAISKSAINLVLKNNGLSSGVGRKPKTRDKKEYLSIDIDCAGAFLLKGIEEQLSLSVILRQFSRNAFPRLNSKTLEYKNNVALYWPVFCPEGLDKLNAYAGPGLWQLASAGRKFSKSSIIKYLDKIEELDIVANIIKGLELGEEYVYFWAMHPKQGQPFYIDPGCHLIWLKPKGIPASYSLPIIKAEDLARDLLFNNKPLVLLSSLPYKPLSNELAAFLSAWSADSGNQIKAVSFLDANGAELSRIDKIPTRRRDFIFAGLPWQLAQLQLKYLKREPNPLKIDLFADEFLLESTEIDFLQPIENKHVKLRIIALLSLASQPRLYLVTNIPATEKSAAEVALTYLNRWPYLEESFENMLKKIELINYPQLAKGYNISNINKLGSILPKEKVSFQRLLMHSLEHLNNLCQSRFFPLSYQKALTFSEMRARFYNLPGRVTQTDDLLHIFINYPANFSWQEDLIYACQRFNEDNCFIRHRRAILAPQKSHT
jgi:hypothetical protein